MWNWDFPIWFFFFKKKEVPWRRRRRRGKKWHIPMTYLKYLCVYSMVKRLIDFSFNFLFNKMSYWAQSLIFFKKKEILISAFFFLQNDFNQINKMISILCCIVGEKNITTCLRRNCRFSRSSIFIRWVLFLAIIFIYIYSLLTFLIRIFIGIRSYYLFIGNLKKCILSTSEKCQVTFLYYYFILFLYAFCVYYNYLIICFSI